MTTNTPTDRSPSPLVAIAGETASGKSALALQIAEKFNGEIICADSWTVYKGFDIGTAKPSTADRARVRHHLLDVADPAEGFNAVKFQTLALAAIDDITSRKRLPILVGGTGLYIDSVLFNYQFLPPTPKSMRQELDKLELAELLEKVDAMGLDMQGIDVRNKRRIVRHIENAGVRPTKHGLRPNTLILGTRVSSQNLSGHVQKVQNSTNETPTEREMLLERVTQRVNVMLAAGLEAEVRSLLHYGWDIEPMKGIGYREWRPFFDGENASQNHDQAVAEVRERIINSTMGLAKRQRTWFKRNNDIQWVFDRSNAVDIVTTFLNKTN